jgi:hypothetical protein
MNYAITKIHPEFRQSAIESIENVKEIKIHKQ